jgi:ADP-heptose:LPS heptosyltransferase
MDEVMHKKICIIQPDGIEALLFTLPSIDGIRQDDHRAEITLITTSDCSEIYEYINGVDTFLDIDTAADDSASMEKHFDLLINFGTSEKSYHLAAALKANVKLGLKDDSNPWILFRNAVANNTSYCSLHMADIFKAIAGVDGTNARYELNPKTALDKTRTILDFSVPKVKIGLTLTSLSDSSIEYILETISSRFDNVHVYLIGTLKEKSRTKTILQTISENTKSKCTDLCGRTSIGELAALSYGLDLMISDFSLPLHFAAGFGTFCVGIFKANDNKNMRTAYGHGHILVGPRAADSDAKKLSEAITNIVDYSLRANPAGNPPTTLQWQSFWDERLEYYMSDVEIYQNQRISYVCNDHKERVILTGLPLLYTGLSTADLFREIYKKLWLQELANTSIPDGEISILREEDIGHITGLLKSLEQLHQLASFGSKYATYIKKDLTEKNLEKAKTSSERLQEVDDAMSNLAEIQEILTPLINHYQLSQSLLQNTEPVRLCDLMQVEYKLLQERILFVLENINSAFHKQKQFHMEKGSLDG